MWLSQSSRTRSDTPLVAPVFSGRVPSSRGAVELTGGSGEGLLAERAGEGEEEAEITISQYEFLAFDD